MADARRRRTQPPPSLAGVPADASDEDLIELVQSLPVTSDRRAAAYEVLVRRYEFVVKAAVRRYRDSPESVEDLMQVGYLGLLKAISHFNPELGPGLIAYAQPCVSGELKRHFRDKRWQVRVHRASQEHMLMVRDTKAVLTQQLGRPPCDEEIAEAAGLSLADLREAERAEMAFRPYYLDTPVSADDEAATFGELLGADDPGIEHALDSDALWAHWSGLPERQQHILAMRFYGNMTQAEIGERLGISQMHVSRLLDVALTSLRDALTAGTARPRPRPRRRAHGTPPDWTAAARVVAPPTGRREAAGPGSREVEVHATGIESQARAAVRAHQGERQETR
jgi:RNA polymerase sigma-B factor